ncbi:MAG: hypothetical protein ABWY22_11530 [Flavobacterium sp.]
MCNIFKRKNNDESKKSKLGDEKENKALVFILILVVLGLFVIAIYSNHSINTYSTFTTLFLVAGAIFTFSNLIGFLFGVPRSNVVYETSKAKSRYIGNDNLLQVSDWITKIILGLGLIQINKMPGFFKHVAKFIMENANVSNQALIILIIFYYACIGFLFGYLWTRLYFIRMLENSDDDINNDETTKVQTAVTTDIITKVTNEESSK